MKSLVKRKEEKPTENGEANAVGGTERKNPLEKIRDVLKKVPKKLKRDYHAVTMKDVADEDDDSDYFDQFEDEDHINTDEIKPAAKDEIVYANASAIKKQAEEKRKNFGREMNEDGLTYVSVDFSEKNKISSPSKAGNNNNNNNSSSNTSKGNDQQEEDLVEYSSLDFTKMPSKNETHQEVTAEVNPTLKDEEKAQPSDLDDGAEADADADGGANLPAPAAAEVDSSRMVAESFFGTAV
ncbi:hypothetical protein PoB_003746800 [Plakobranchus ocellatus]|uniref:Uncharacterized protein n=1 Tax=Plakobranchus ocellatus TaxID=259542 RepID=A0AAV4AWR7_9GAST|nr:hypothetical protein PoB_003746800 [Plakobranchus ocellatus]